MHKRVKEIFKEHINYDVILERPKEKSFGHLSTPIAFSLAKELKKSPKIIAEEISKKIGSNSSFESVNAISGYVNVKLSDEFLNEYATDALKNESDFGRGDRSEKILLEFVSANPTGPLHIGHARGAIVGDAILKIGRYLGYKIDSEYYINDAGRQLYLLGLSIFLAGRELLGFSVEWPNEYYRGEYIIDVAKLAIDKLSKELFLDEKNIEKLADFGKNEMLITIKNNLFSVGIEFDNFVSERECYSDWDRVFDKLKANSSLYLQDGKYWLKSMEYGDEKDRVVVREDGKPTYLAGDIIYHNMKFERNYDKYINIWGADHHGYIPRVKASIKFLGFDESKLEVILSQMVALLKNGEPYKMSKRAGNFILMSDVVDEIGSDALRFIFLSKKSDTHLEFDVEDLKKEDSTNPIYYINYAHARVISLFEKASKTLDDVIDVPLINLNSDAKDLVFDSLLLPSILEDAFSTKAPNRVVDYLKTIASMVHKFYYDNRVIGSESENIYLKVLAISAMSIRVGMKLLGVNVKYKM